MRDIEILNQHPGKVLDKLQLGEVDSIEYGVEQITDEFMIYGLRGGLIDELSKSFPDPRKECEITFKQILCASIAGHFQDMYAISLSSRKWGSVAVCSTLTYTTIGVRSECEGINKRSRYIKTWNTGKCALQWRCNP